MAGEYLSLAQLGANPPGSTYSTTPATNSAATSIGPDQGPFDDGSISALTIVSLASPSAGIFRHYGGDFYFRIWVVPPVLRVLNPRTGVLIPFDIWNAYPESNALNTVGGSGQTGLTLNFTPPTTYKEIEYRTVGLTIGPTAPLEIDAIYLFNFAQGVGNFEFVAVLTEFLNTLPDVKSAYLETWDWLTDIIESHNGKEQRIALRDNPRVGVQFEVVLEDEADRRLKYKKLYTAVGSNTIVPMLQYTSLLTQASAIGAVRVYFDPSRTDIRVGDYIIFIDPQTEAMEIAKVSIAETDGATLDAPLTFAATLNMIVCPGVLCRLANPSGPEMFSLGGRLRMLADSLYPRPVLRPGQTLPVQLFDTYPVLSKRPLAESEVGDLFDVGYEIVDGETGFQEIKSAWPHSFPGGEREFFIQRHFSPADMDFWRDFFNRVKGRRDPFLLPSYRPDLIVALQPSNNDQLKIVEEDYVLGYFPYQTYKRLQIETAAHGTLWRKVLVAIDNGDNTANLTLDANFPSGVNVTKVSFMNLARLSDDRVELTHRALDTILSMHVTTRDA